jgi:uncharacterized membrane protein
MPRTVTVTVPAEQTDELIARVSSLDGLIGLRLQPGISKHPPGDVVSLDVTNRALHPLVRLLDERGIGRRPPASIATSDPTSLVSPSMADAIANDVTESTWEEMQAMITRESNMTADALLLMGISGVVAALGIATAALHLVVAAMVIAPGFEPLVRVALGTVAGSRRVWRRGLLDSVKGYAAMLAGAVGAGVFLRLAGKSPLGGESSYLAAGTLTDYWLTLTASSIVVSTVGGIAGALLVANQRSVLTAGVMIALALVPPVAIAGLALTSGQLAPVGAAGMRWVVEVAIVTVAALLVLGWKRVRVHQRTMQM